MVTDVGEPRAAGQRERTKDARRQRIIEAADGFLRRMSGDALTITAVAAKAGVSPATVYNLFGAKGALIAQVYEHDVRRFHRLVTTAPSPDALQRLVDYVRIAAGLFRNDPEFYKVAPWTRAQRIENRERFMAQGAPRMRLLHALVEAIIHEGYMRPDADADALGILLSQIASGTLADFSWGRIDVAGRETETLFGFASVLYAFATPTARERLAPFLEPGLAAAPGR